KRIGHVAADDGGADANVAEADMRSAATGLDTDESGSAIQQQVFAGGGAGRQDIPVDRGIASGGGGAPAGPTGAPQDVGMDDMPHGDAIERLDGLAGGAGVAQGAVDEDDVVTAFVVGGDPGLFERLGEDLPGVEAADVQGSAGPGAADDAAQA